VAADMRLKVAVIGGGVGGLAAATVLAREGIEVTVLERSPSLSRLGAGISFGPNATRLLADLGLLDRLRAAGHCPPAMRFLRWDNGEVLLNTPLGPEAEAHFGAPLVRCERATILDVLYGAVPKDSVKFGAHVTGLTQDLAGVELQLDGGERVRADVAIAADGVRSTIRHQLTGIDDPIYSGTVVYRALVPSSQARDIGVDLSSAQYYWLGPGCHVVAGALSDAVVDFNVSVERGEEAEESWTKLAPPSEAVGHLAGWHEPVRRLVALGENVLRGAVFVRGELKQWAFGRVALLGDAAHAMAPFEAQGGVQAIEDSVVLAACLRGVDAAGAPAALERYARLRMERATDVQNASRGRGSILNLADGADQEQRDAWFRELPSKQRFGTRQQLWEHDVRDSLAAR
jgi:salicylate hydroxylase